MKRIFKGTASVVLILMVVLGCVIPTFASMSKTDKFILTNYKQTGDGATDIVNIAMAQEGLSEDVLDYADSWCAAFISDCAEIAGQSSAIPRNAGVNDLKEAVLKAGGDEIDELKNVKKGDLCFIDWYGDGEGTDFDHVEVVYQDAVGNEVYTIGGNTGKNVDSVYRHDPINSSWHLNNGIILCIVRPNYKNNENIKTGKCGENVTYTFDKSTGTLTISGTGEMYDYYVSEYPYGDDRDRAWESYSSDIKTVIVSEGVTHIGQFAFGECTSLTKVTIAESVISIGNDAFGWCDNLTSLVIPERVKKIGMGAFCGCGITNITIPKSVTSIGKYAFEFTENLTNLNVDSANTVYSSDEQGVLFNKNKTELIQYPIGNERKTYTIPNSVTSIGECAFEGCKLESVIMPNTVTSIEEFAFGWCPEMKDVYYTGSEEEWNELVEKGYNYNGDLYDSNIHYNYTEKEPTFIEKVISFFQQIISFFVNLFKF